MGSSASKAGRTVGSTVRKYPTRIPEQSGKVRPTNTRSTRPRPDESRGPTVRPEARASRSRDEAINRDASDPDLAFNARLAQLGPVQPSPTFSNSSTFTIRSMKPASLRSASTTNDKTQSTSPVTSSYSSFHPSVSTPGQSVFPSPAANPAIELLTARSRLAQEAEEEFENLGRKGAQGRRFLDVVTVRQILMMRDELGTTGGEIERKLGLGKGMVGKLGARGVLSGAGA